MQLSRELWMLYSFFRSFEVAKQITQEIVLTRVGELCGVKAIQHASVKRKEYHRMRNRASKMRLTWSSWDLELYVPWNLSNANFDLSTRITWPKPNNLIWRNNYLKTKQNEQMKVIVNNLVIITLDQTKTLNFFVTGIFRLMTLFICYMTRRYISPWIYFEILTTH